MVLKCYITVHMLQYFVRNYLKLYYFQQTIICFRPHQHSFKRYQNFITAILKPFKCSSFANWTFFIYIPINESTKNNMNYKKSIPNIDILFKTFYNVQCISTTQQDHIQRVPQSILLLCHSFSISLFSGLQLHNLD